uniref:Centromere protein S n=1 Tax=Gadus morhua TaxID=8049 RepID=A0A8C5B2V6_GADMO
MGRLPCPLHVELSMKTPAFRMALDLETYANHAKRKTIEVADVELLLRRSVVRQQTEKRKGERVHGSLYRMPLNINLIHSHTRGQYRVSNHNEPTSKSGRRDRFCQI